ncbi:MAG: S8 family serine peptidase [Pseudomonadota bacterium]
MSWVREIWARSGKQLRRLGGFLLAALVIGFGVEWIATSNARMIQIEPSAINDLALSPDGSVLAVAYANGIVELRETGHGRRLIRRFGSAQKPVMDLHLDEATEAGLRLTMARADGRLLLETAREGQRLSDDLTFTPSLLTPQFIVADDGAIWAHGINEQGPWMGRLEPNGNFAQPLIVGSSSTARMNLLSANSRRAHLLTGDQHTIWETYDPEIDSGIERPITIRERLPLSEGYVELQTGEVMTAVNGAWRTATENFIEDERGGIVMYGGGAQGEGTTASGEPFNSNALTAAHRTLPFGSVLEVTNETNGQTATVRVNDRGPFEDGAVLGVTSLGAMQLGLLTSTIESGSPTVRIKYLGTRNQAIGGELLETRQLETSARDLVERSQNGLTAATISPNGDLIALGDKDGNVLISYLETGTLITSSQAQGGPVSIIKFSKDGSRLLTVGADAVLRVWETSDWTQLGERAFQTQEIYSANFSPDGTLIATVTVDENITVWNADTLTEAYTLDQPGPGVLEIDFSPDGTLVSTASSNGSIRTWNAADGSPMRDVAGSRGTRMSAQFSADGSALVFTQYPATVVVLDIATLDTVVEFSTLEQDSRPSDSTLTNAVLSPDGTKILTTDLSNTVSLWDADFGILLSTIATGTGQTRSAVFSPDGSKILTASADGTAAVWTERSPDVWVPARTGFRCDSANGQAFVETFAGGEPRSLWMWSNIYGLCEDAFDAGRLRWASSPPQDTTVVKFLPDISGRKIDSILIGHTDGTVEHRDGKAHTVYARYQGHGGAITHIEPSENRDDMRVAIGAADGSVQIIELPGQQSSFFATTNTNMIGLVSGINALRTGLIDTVLPAPNTDGGEARPYTLNDPLLSQQWSLESASTLRGGAGFREYWEKTGNIGSPDVVVAHVDSGYDPSLPDFANMSFLPGVDMVADLETANDGDARDFDPTDPGDVCPERGILENSYHGSHNFAAMTAPHDDVGIAGFAPGVSYVPVRAMGTCGGRLSAINDGIRWAAGTIPELNELGDEVWNDNPADIIVLPLGLFRTCPPSMQDAINSVTERGIIVVSAAGNAAVEAEFYTPAGCENVISVTASDARGMLAPYSNYGSSVDLMAPGGDLTRDDNRDGAPDGVLSAKRASDCVDPETGAAVDQCFYAYEQGTSMAAMHVAGALALIKSQFPDLNSEELTATLLDRATRPTIDRDVAVPVESTPGCEEVIDDGATCLRRAGGRILDMTMLVNGGPPAAIVDNTPSVPATPREGSLKRDALERDAETDAESELETTE